MPGCRRLLFLQHIEILQASASVEKYHALSVGKECRFARRCLTQSFICGETRGPFRRSEYSFSAAPLVHRIFDLLITYGYRRAAASFQNIENEVIAIRLRDAKSCRNGRCILP